MVEISEMPEASWVEHSIPESRDSSFENNDVRFTPGLEL